MKNTIFLFCMYLTLITAWPTLRVMKQHFNESCSKSCCERTTKPSSKSGNSGCQKEKCIFNLNISIGQYLVQPIESISLNDNRVYVAKKTLEYHKSFISKYNVSIWHPPKSYFLS